MDLSDFDKYRTEFPITRSYTFMNHAAISPIPIRVVKAVEAILREFAYCGTECYPKWMKMIGETRRLFARLINSGEEEIAFVENTSAGLSTIANGLKWREGDAVLVPDPEFPANVYPWMNLERKGVVPIFIRRKRGRIGTKEIERALSSSTRLIAISSVDFSTGYLCDLEAIGDFCRRKGLIFCVDAIQSLGIIPMDVRKYGIHFLAAGGHKWLLSTTGCGAIFVSSEVSDIVHPEIVGWKSVEDDEDFFKTRFSLKRDASRFEPGTMNIIGICALGEAIGLLLEVGIENVRRRVLEINDLLLNGLRSRNIEVISPRGREERSGILSFTPIFGGNSLFKFLTEERVVVSLRGGKLRLSPHFYNNSKDVQHFFEVLDRFRETL